ncbi:hypothetical protein J6590_029333, partial [Homalodisca vitripennis]
TPTRFFTVSCFLRCQGCLSEVVRLMAYWQDATPLSTCDFLCRSGSPATATLCISRSVRLLNMELAQ